MIFFDIGVELDQALQELHSQKKKALIGIDEVSRSPEMEAFASEFGKWLRAGYPIYLVCTGLYENIEQLYNVKNLTFFRRASTIKTQPLNHIKMTEMYRQKLGVDLDTAKELSRTTKGYAYAFQELGALYFRKKPADTPDMILQQLKAELFAYAYEKIWEELSEKDRELVRILSEKPELSRKEILAEMSKPGNYPVYRDRLQKRGIITTRQGYAGLSLPFFGDYIREYGMS